jgi:hypothetical protein
MPFTKGHGGKGRPKGIPNKVSTSAREAVLQVFQEIGGVPAFSKWARENPTEYYKIHSRLLPKEVELSGGVDFKHEISETLMERLSEIYSNK